MASKAKPRKQARQAGGQRGQTGGGAGPCVWGEAQARPLAVSKGKAKAKAMGLQGGEQCPGCVAAGSAAAGDGGSATCTRMGAGGAMARKGSWGGHCLQEARDAPENAASGCRPQQGYYNKILPNKCRETKIKKLCETKRVIFSC
jgi:hypothetical protein